ncbi:uncharacterized protein [Drosophila takahashii]|uniref:uncharacterized protein n=1 Tax=Drosophila takahashii TaxID=29030 RepID=UPI001CF84177|nr:uncharacterized protein LOC108067936 [Drosophila takahashii]
MQSLYCAGIIFLISGSLAEAISVGKASRQLTAWEYSIISVSMTTDNEELAGGETHIDRISRGEYGLSGSLYTNVDVPQDFEVTVTIYRSTDNGDTYKIQPYSLPRQTVYQAMNSFYKNAIMPSVVNCSNLPQFKGTLEFIPATLWTFEKCQVNTDGFPQYMPDGWYKGVIESHGYVNLIWTGVFSVKQRTF